MQLGSEKRRRYAIIMAAAMVGVLALATVTWVVTRREPQAAPPEELMHQDVRTTVFWVGEPADAANDFIHNFSSTWVENWVGTYGGEDDPNDRCGYQPCGFTPKENPFYFALPYSDLDEACNAKPSQQAVPWFDGTPAPGHSIVKDSWIKINYQGRTVYAQWEDAGPFGEDDTGYVFGESEPQANAGLDVSPAVADYLDIPGEADTSWEFIDASKVPDGPWLKTITDTKTDCTAG